jgi:acetyl-CoA/propionyl-CoA carboxylase biotin carboxyl carrier protein
MATALPFHRAVVDDPAFAPPGGAPFTVHTRWIETEFVNTLPMYSTAAADPEEPPQRQRLVVEVGGRRVEVSLPGSFALGAANGGAGAGAAPRRRPRGRGGAAASSDALLAPMQGTIVKIAVDEGGTVAAGDLVLVLEAMKMEQPITAHKAGTVRGLAVEIGATVAGGTALCEIRG